MSAKGTSGFNVFGFFRGLWQASMLPSFPFFENNESLHCGFAGDALPHTEAHWGKESVPGDGHVLVLMANCEQQVLRGLGQEGS